jgi:hypothetical protein
MPRKITPIDGAELRALVQAGKTLAEIGALSGVAAITVYRWTRLYGLRTISNKGRPRTDPAPLVRVSGRNKGPKPVIQSVRNVRPSARALFAANPFGLGA